MESKTLEEPPVLFRLEVTVCIVVSVFIHVTVSPIFTLAGDGSEEKSEKM